MNCPRCDRLVSTLNPICAACGLDISYLRDLDGVRTDLKQACEGVENLAHRLQDLERSLSQFGRSLGASLSAPYPPAAQPLPVKESLPEPESQLEPLEDFETTIPERPIRPVDAASAAPPAIEHDASVGEMPRGQAFKSYVETLSETRQTQQRDKDGEWFHQYEKPHAPFLDRAAELRIGQIGMLIVGIIVVVFGVGYFLKYAFDRNWVGPVGRIALAYAGGATLLLGGEYFRRKDLRIFGLYLVGGGIAVLYFSGYAAFQIYCLITQPIAFLLMVIVTAFAGLLALRHDVMWLAVLGIIGGFLTPVILRTNTDNQIALMGYMTILNAGILSLAMFKRWGLLNSLGFAFTWLLFSAWYGTHYDSTKFVVTMVFLNIFFLVYAIAPFAFFFVRLANDSRPGMAIVFLNAFIAFGFSFAMIERIASRRALSIVSTAYAVLYAVMAWYLRRRKAAAKPPFLLLAGMAIFFATITIPLFFRGQWITVFWALQSAILAWAGLHLADRRLVVAGQGLLVIVLVKLISHDMTDAFWFEIDGGFYATGYWRLFASRWLTLLSVHAAVFVVAMMLRKLASSQPTVWPERTFVFWYSVFGCLAFAWLNVEDSGLFHDELPAARFASFSVLWAVCSIVLMVLGFAFNVGVIRRCALGLFTATLLKVILLDMADVSTPYRIVSFLVLGTMLIGASYLYHRYKTRILPVAGSPEA